MLMFHEPGAVVREPLFGYLVEEGKGEVHGSIC